MLRQLLYECRKITKSPVNSIIGIFGLSVGIAIFVLGLLYLHHERSYDQGFSSADHIYRIETVYADGHTGLSRPIPVADLMASRCPGLISSTKFLENSVEQPLLTTQSGKTLYAQHLFQADSTFFEVFDFPFIAGNRRQVLQNTHSIVLSKDFAYSLFGKTDPIGQTVSLSESGTYQVSGVYDNTSFPSHLTFDAVIPLPKLTSAEDPWYSQFTYTYLRIHPNTPQTVVEKQLNIAFQQARASFPNKIGGTALQLTSVPRIYLHGQDHVGADIFKKGNSTGLWLITCLVTFVLIVSMINFTNLNLAEASSRAKEIAIRRFIGSSRSRVLSQLYLGVSIKCITALFLALAIIICILPYFSQALGIQLSPFSGLYTTVWLQLIILLAAIVIITGTYPVLYVTLLNFANVIKGNASHSRRGNTVRHTLLAIQFAITCVFVGGVLIIRSQLHYLAERDLGFNPNQVLIIRYGELQTMYKYDQIKQSILQIPGVENVSFASQAGILSDKMNLHLTVDGQKYSAPYLSVDTGYLSVMQAHILAGTNFSAVDTGTSVIINQNLASAAGIHTLGENVVLMNGTRANVIGIVSNLNFYGFEQSVGPMAFTTKKITLTPYVLIRANTASLPNTIAAITNQWKSIEPGFPIRLQFMDDSFDQIYKGYNRLNQVFSLFLTCSIVLAFIGLFSIASLTILQRTKELAIRRVHGASSWQILRLVNRNFIAITILANFLSIPVTYLLAQKWLDHFAYRDQFHILPYIVAFVTSILITTITVSLQSLKAMHISPTKVLKQE